jgi:hypothetical protein
LHACSSEAAYTSAKAAAVAAAAAADALQGLLGLPPPSPWLLPESREEAVVVVTSMIKSDSPSEGRIARSCGNSSAK